MEILQAGPLMMLGQDIMGIVIPISHMRRSGSDYRSTTIGELSASVNRLLVAGD
jgi:hypothetical protein